MPKSSSDKKPSYLGVGIALGVAIGAAFGLIFGDLALGIGPGIALGIAIALALSATRLARMRSPRQTQKMTTTATGPDDGLKPNPLRQQVALFAWSTSLRGSAELRCAGERIFQSDGQY